MRISWCLIFTALACPAHAIELRCSGTAELEYPSRAAIPFAAKIVVAGDLRFEKTYLEPLPPGSLIKPMPLERIYPIQRKSSIAYDKLYWNVPHIDYDYDLADPYEEYVQYDRQSYEYLDFTLRTWGEGKYGVDPVTAPRRLEELRPGDHVEAYFAISWWADGYSDWSSKAVDFMKCTVVAR